MKASIAITFLSALPLFCGCNQESFSGTKIDIAYFDKTSVFPDETQKKKVLKSVYIHGQEFLAEPKDLCFEDTLCYILDVNLSVSCVNLNSGEIIRQIHTIGNGHHEYIMPQALCSYGGFVYLLDIAKRNIIKYDRMLTPISSFTTDYTAWDFIKTDSGFLFLSLTDNQGTEIVYSDEDGKKACSFAASDILLDSTLGSKSFTRNKKGEIYLKNPFEDDIYRWNKELLKPELAYRIDYSSHGISQTLKKGSDILFSDKYHTDTFFASENGIFFSYINADSRFYASYNNRKDRMNAGAVSPSPDNIPFYPRWQHGDLLVGIMPCEEPEPENTTLRNDSCQAVLMLFDMNDMLNQEAIIKS
ncbi:MAG: 6-bladed beta-propeller [Prevotellaceae bacterium]|nr:6-bladed beta-propeller [Prevotellaceae bacterium]